MTALLHANVTALPEQVQSVYLQSALKLYVTASGDAAKRGLGGKSLRPSASGGGGGGSVDLLGSETSSVSGSVTSSVVDLLSQAETTVPATNGDKMQELVAFASSTSAPAAVPPAAPGSASGSGMTGLFCATPAAGKLGGDEDMDSFFGANIPPAPAAAATTENGAASREFPGAASPAVAAVGASGASGGGAEVKGGNLGAIGELLEKRLGVFEKSTLLEVQERACFCHHILELARDADLAGPTNSETLHTQLSLLFEDELNPVAPKAQAKVAVPEGLDLDERINPVEEEEEEESDATVEESDEEREQERKKKNKRRDKASILKSVYTVRFIEEICLGTNF